MGNTTKSAGKLYNKLQIDIALAKCTAYLKLTRDRRVEALQKKEDEIKQKLEYGPMTMSQTYSVACIACRHLTWIRGANKVIRHLDVLRNNSIALEIAQEKPSRAADLTPSLNTVIWATYKLNVEQMEEFVEMVRKVLGDKWVDLALHGYMVDIYLRGGFEHILPPQEKVNEYLWGFVNRLAKGDEAKKGEFHSFL